MSMRRVTTEFTGLAGAPYLNQLYFDAATGTATEAASAVDAFWEAMDNFMDSNLGWARQPDIATINEVNGTLEGLETVSQTSGTGDVAGEVSPTVLQALVRWRTEVVFDGRLLQGRTFSPGVPEAGLSDGVLVESYRAGYETAAAALVANISTALVVWHRPVFSDPPTDPPTIVRNGAFAHVVVAIVGSGFAVLRSRRD
jgi:hypothetical protein